MSNHLICVAPETAEAAKTNFTMCPNWIYDSVLLNESHSVAKVVLFVNRNTTGRTGRDGKRVETVQASYGWIAKEMSMSLRAVGEAVRIALAKGYILQVKPGQIGGEGAWYSLNWNWANGIPETNNATEPVSASYVKQAGRQFLPEDSTQIWQDLPVKAEQLEQSLPPCINRLESNKLIEIKHLPDSNSTNDFLEAPEETNGKRKGSATIGRLITDFTRELGDAQSLTLSNVGRALNLWNASGLSEKDFVASMYQARQKTAGAAIQKKRQSNADYSNRMPYFFAVLTNILTEASGQECPSHSVPIIVQHAITSMKADGKILAAESFAEPVKQPASAQVVASQNELASRLSWLSEPKKRALAQAELQPLTDAKAYYEVRFAQSWQRNLFTDWEKEQITYAVAELKGQHLASGTVLFS